MITAKRIRQPEQDFGLTTLKAILSFGLLAIIISAIFLKKEGSFWQVTGLSMVISLAAIITGGFLGFLFGIPRHIDKSNPSLVRSFGANTNLEQISDWLTKIIVGVSLTQMPAIEKRLHYLTNKIAEGFGDSMSTKYSYPYSGALLTFFFVCGFLYVYLWCMLYLIDQVNDVKNYIDKVQEESADKIELQKVKDQIASFNEKRNKIIIEESSDEFKAVIEKAKPAAITVLDDCQKNRWGGKPTSDLLEMSATFENNILDEDNSFLVNVMVSFKDPLNYSDLGAVYFFLHDTYCPGSIRKVISQNGKALLQVPSFEACTIGAYVEELDNKLELDLNIYPQSPEEYRYAEVLPTIDELRQREKELEEK